MKKSSYLTHPLRPCDSLKVKSTNSEIERQRCDDIVSSLYVELQEQGMLESFETETNIQSEINYINTGIDIIQRKYSGLCDPEHDSWTRWQLNWKRHQLQLQNVLQYKISDRRPLLSSTSTFVAYRKRLERADIYRSKLSAMEKNPERYWEMSLRDNHEKMSTIGNIFSGLYSTIKEKNHPVELIRRPYIIEAIDAGLTVADAISQHKIIVNDPTEHTEEVNSYMNDRQLNYLYILGEKYDISQISNSDQSLDMDKSATFSNKPTIVMTPGELQSIRIENKGDRCMLLKLSFPYNTSNECKYLKVSCQFKKILPGENYDLIISTPMNVNTLTESYRSGIYFQLIIEKSPLPEPFLSQFGKDLKLIDQINILLTLRETSTLVGLKRSSKYLTFLRKQNILSFMIETFDRIIDKVWHHAKIEQRSAAIGSIEVQKNIASFNDLTLNKYSFGSILNIAMQIFMIQILQLEDRLPFFFEHVLEYAEDFFYTYPSIDYLKETIIMLKFTSTTIEQETIYRIESEWTVFEREGLYPSFTNAFKSVLFSLKCLTYNNYYNFLIKNLCCITKWTRNISSSKDQLKTSFQEYLLDILELITTNKTKKIESTEMHFPTNQLRFFFAEFQKGYTEGDNDYFTAIYQNTKTSNYIQQPLSDLIKRKKQRKEKTKVQISLSQKTVQQACELFDSLVIQHIVAIFIENISSLNVVQENNVRQLEQILEIFEDYKDLLSHPSNTDINIIFTVPIGMNQAIAKIDWLIGKSTSLSFIIEEEGTSISDTDTFPLMHEIPKGILNDSISSVNILLPKKRWSLLHYQIEITLSNKVSLVCYLSEYIAESAIQKEVILHNQINKNTEVILLIDDDFCNLFSCCTLYDLKTILCQELNDDCCTNCNIENYIFKQFNDGSHYRMIRQLITTLKTYYDEESISFYYQDESVNMQERVMKIIKAADCDPTEDTTFIRNWSPDIVQLLCPNSKSATYDGICILGNDYALQHLL